MNILPDELLEKIFEIMDNKEECIKLYNALPVSKQNKFQDFFKDLLEKFIFYVLVSVKRNVYVIENTKIIHEFVFPNDDNFVAFIPKTKKYLIASKMGLINLYDIRVCENRFLLKTNPILALKVSPNGKHLVIVQSNRDICLLNIGNLKTLKTFNLGLEHCYDSPKIEFNQHKSCFFVSTCWLIHYRDSIPRFIHKLHVYNYEKDILTEYYREDMQRPIHFNKQGDKIIFRKKRFLESGERIRNNHAFGIINLDKDLDDETVIELEDKYNYCQIKDIVVLTNKIYFIVVATLFLKNHIACLNLDTGLIDVIVESDNHFSYMKISDDEKMILCESNNCNLYLVNIETRESTQIFRVNRSFDYLFEIDTINF